MAEVECPTIRGRAVIEQTGGLSKKVSVCVPSFNHSRFVQDNLESVFAQTHTPVELIVIDDGSNDGSVEVIKSVLSKSPFPTKLVSRPNKGLAKTINEGLDMASGEFFAVLASDDIWLPEFLEMRIKQLESRPDAVVAYGNCLIVDEAGQVVGNTESFADYDDGNVRNMLLTRYPPSSPSVLFRRSALDVYRWRPDAIVEDMDLYLRLCTVGEFAFDPKPLSCWRVHGSNTSKNTNLMIKGSLEAVERNAEIIGLTDDERSKFHSLVKWTATESLYQAGERRAALRLALGGFNYDVPLLTKLKVFARLLMPRRFVNLVRRGRQNN